MWILPTNVSMISASGVNMTLLVRKNRKRNDKKRARVYVIHDKKLQRIIYAGRTKNLRRRLLSDHRRGNIEGSQFRKALGQSLGTGNEKEIRKYIEENCSFRFMVVENFEEMVRLEHFVTAVIAPTLNVKLKH